MPKTKAPIVYDSTEKKPLVVIPAKAGIHYNKRQILVCAKITNIWDS